MHGVTFARRVIFERKVNFERRVNFARVLFFTRDGSELNERTKLQEPTILHGGSCTKILSSNMVYINFIRPKFSLQLQFTQINFVLIIYFILVVGSTIKQIINLLLRIFSSSTQKNIMFESVMVMKNINLLLYK